MYGGVAEFTACLEGDSVEFIEKVRAITAGVVRDHESKRLCMVRIDNWFGPKWMKFAGKFTAGKGFAVGVHKARLHVPPFVPARVVAERVLAGPAFEESVTAAALHVDCTSRVALGRLIADIDKQAVFVWFSGESMKERRGALMVYPPVGDDGNASGKRGLHDSGAFYAGFAEKDDRWEPAMLRGVSRRELTHFEETGRTSSE